MEHIMKDSLLVKILSLALFLLPSALYAEISSMDEARKQIEAISDKIDKNRKNAALFTDRADLYFMIHDFDNAVEDCTTAIKLDASLDKAWFVRGMAHGRMGLIDEGIADLSVFIERNPNDSRALTKRGVRYLWKGDKKNAQRDLEKAIKIDPTNAEAHDDLGVILAQLGFYNQAISHFSKTVSIEPDYQKGHHNLAMALFVIEKDALALSSVNIALALSPESRNSMLLKSNILKTMGNHAEAKRLEDEAMFLPEANWSETAPVR